MKLPISVTQIVDGSAYVIEVRIAETVIALTPAEAEEAGGLLYEGSIEPDRCRFCEHFSTIKVDGDDLCSRHAKALDDSREASAS